MPLSFAIASRKEGETRQRQLISRELIRLRPSSTISCQRGRGWPPATSEVVFGAECCGINRDLELHLSKNGGGSHADDAAAQNSYVSAVWYRDAQGGDHRPNLFRAPHDKVIPPPPWP